MRIHKGLASVWPQNRTTEPVAIPLREYYLGDFKTVSRVLLGVVGFVLLIACLNVSGLMFARGASRTQEFAIRSALGAGRARLVRQLLAESLLLAGAGAASGAFGGWLAVRSILSLMPRILPSWVDFGLDLHFLWFALAVTSAVVLVSGLTPALELSKAASLATGGTRFSPSGRTRRSMNLLVVSEVARAGVRRPRASGIAPRHERSPGFPAGKRADVLRRSTVLQRPRPTARSLCPGVANTFTIRTGDFGCGYDERAAAEP
jgi:hypothetical protein